MSIGKSANVLNEGLHLRCTEGTVETKRHGVGVLEGSDKCFTSLTRESTTTLIDNGTRNEDWNLWAPGAILKY